MSLASGALRRPVTTVAATLAFVLVGAVSLGQLPVSLLPDVSLPVLTIRTAYRGAAATEVSRFIAEPIEEAVAATPGLVDLRSVSRNGEALTTLRFSWGTRMAETVLQVRERLLILPIIGIVDSERARQLTEQLLRGVRANRAKVVVMDITGVPSVDATVANHLVQTVEASRLLGATVIVTGLSPEIAQTLVTIGVDLTKMNTVGDLQGGIEEAELLLGYKVLSVGEAPPQAESN